MIAECGTIAESVADCSRSGLEGGHWHDGKRESITGESPFREAELKSPRPQSV